jgi:cyclic pyranopterin phosphate synthase
MSGEELPTETVLNLIRDAAAAGMSSIGLYGGEPLLHAGLPAMIKESVRCGMTPFVSTNGILLSKRLEPMVQSGLRIVTFGYYGHGATYDAYVGKQGAWAKFEANVEAARAVYGDQLKLHMSYVLNTRTCSLTELRKAWSFAERYSLMFHVDLVHYSLPYFSEGPNHELQFTVSDRGPIDVVTRELEGMRRSRPDLYREPITSIRSIPDWLLKGPEMRVPCDAYNMIWVGADGSVRLCFVDFPLGNLHQQPLSQMLFNATHKSACRGAFQLKCPNCHCGRDTRIVKHLPSLLRYALPTSGVSQSTSARESPFPMIR